jgi:FixJ family two-component response regulator
MNDVRPLIFVVDDEPSICTALERLFRSVGLEVWTFSSAQAFLRSERPDVPACLVLDVRLPDLSGLDIQDRLLREGVDIPVVFITGHGDIPMSVRAMKAGAVEFLTKPFKEQELLDAVQQAIERHRVARQLRAEIQKFRSRFLSLTPRERQVFPLVTAGLLNKEIAAELGTSEKTVKIHRSRVMTKMNAKSLAHLVHIAEKLKVTALYNQHDETKVR